MPRRRRPLRGSRGRCGRRFCGEHREFELEAEAADPGTVWIDGSQAAARGGQGGSVVAGVAGFDDARDQLGPDRLDRLVQQRADIPAAFLEPVEQGDAGRPIASNEVIDERLHELGVSQAEEVADMALLDPLRRRRQELVEHRFGVAHPAGREPGDEVEGSRFGLAPIRRQDPGELALDLRDRETPDVEPLEARQDRRREARRLGRSEHEHHEVGRLLERLEQCVPGVLGDLVRLVEDVDLAPELAGRVRQSLAQVAHGIDAAVAGGVDLDQVERRAVADRDA